MDMTLVVCWPACRSLNAEQVEGFSGVPTFIMGMSMGGALAVQTIRAVVRPFSKLELLNLPDKQLLRVLHPAVSGNNSRICWTCSRNCSAALYCWPRC